jgi:hypothetical protein
MKAATMIQFNCYYYLYTDKIHTIQVMADGFDTAIAAAQKVLGQRVNIFSVFKAS